MTPKAPTVYKHNALITARYFLTLSEQLMLLECIASTDPATLTADTAVELSAARYASVAGIGAKDAYDDLKTASERLFSRHLIIDRPDPDDPALDHIKTRWIHKIAYYTGEGRIRLFFAPAVIPYLAQLSGNFSRYKLSHVSNFRSSYGVRLYELLIQWRGAGSREVTVAWLRERWGLETKYKAIKDLKRWVIAPAMRDINAHSNVRVSVTQIKRGRAIHALKFTFGTRAAKKSEAADREFIKAHARPGESWATARRRLSDALLDE